MDAKQRLSVMIDDARRRLHTTEVEAIRAIDAQIVPLFRDTIESLPTTKQTLLGLVGLAQAVDERLAELGHRQFLDNPRINGAKNYFSQDDTTVEAVMAPNPNVEGNLSAIELYEAVRRDLWSQITK